MLLSRLFSSALAAVLITVVAVVSSPPATAEVAREHVIVQVRDADPAAVAREISGRHGGRVSHVYRHAVSGFAAELPTRAVRALRSDPRVLSVEPDLPVELFGEVPTGVARAAVTVNTTAAIDGSDDLTDRVDVDIAVLDSGIDSTHPDLNVAGGVDCSSGTCVPVAAPVDVHGHGTHVAGTAAAIDDGAGVVGAAPGARLWSVQVLDADGQADLSAMVAGLDWLVDNADTIEIANASLGCACTSATLDRAVGAVADAGIVMIAAAGNSSEDVGGWALTAHPDVITVSALADLDGAPGGEAPDGCGSQSDDTLASFSNFGDEVDLAAPGVCIRSTVLGGYLTASGTSMSAPHVAGAAALYIVEHGIARDASRPAAVRDGMITDWSVRQSSACGFSGGISSEPLLYLTDCAADNTAPEVTIDEPAEGTTITSGTSITLAGNASDAEDGDLTSSISWSSDVDGRMGKGGEISVVLSEGAHVVSAVVEDEIGSEATDTVTVHVEPTDDTSSSDGDTSSSDGDTSTSDGDSSTSDGGTSTSDQDQSASIGRLAGSDRTVTSVEISRQVFADGAKAAVIAFAGGFPDALAATPLAAALDGPVLLNHRDQLHPDVGRELDRLGVGTAYLMGGTAVQTKEVEQALKDRGLRTVRVAGADRFSTAADAAQNAVETWQAAGDAPSSNAVLALGTDFPDALSGGPLAAARRAPLLLTARHQLPDATAAALRELGVRSVTVMGGSAAVDDAVVQRLRNDGFTVDRIAGATRFGTAVDAADAAVRAGAGYRSVLIASGRSFPDALAGASAVAARNGVLLLSERDHLPDPSSEALRRADDVDWVRLAGGTAVLTDAVRDEAVAASGISP